LGRINSFRPTVAEKRGLFFGEKISPPIIEVEVDGRPEVDTQLQIRPHFLQRYYPWISPTAGRCLHHEKRWMENLGSGSNIEQAQDWTRIRVKDLEGSVKEPVTTKIELNYAGSGRLVWILTSDEEMLFRTSKNLQRSTIIMNGDF